MKKLVALLLALMLVLSLAACGSKDDSAATPESTETTTDAPAEETEDIDEINLKFSTSTSETSTWTLAAYKFAELVEERSGGKITCDVYSSDQLSGGNQAKGIEMVMNGSTDMSFHSNLVYSTIDDRFNVVSLPFMFDSTDEVDEKLAGEAGDALKDILAEYGLECLGFGENGFRQITNSVREIKTVEDFAGIKFRINNSNMLIATYKCLGADPTSMNWTEVFTSLQQGAIEGQENPLDVIYSSSIQEVQDYISLWGCTYDALFLCFNQETMDGLTPATQEIIRTCAAEACEYQKEINRANGGEQLAAFEEAGMTITQREDMDIDAIIEAVQPVYEEYEPIVGSDLLALFQDK